jgi:hypothetical protein
MIDEVSQLNKCIVVTKVETSVSTESEMIPFIKWFDTTTIPNDLLPCQPITNDTVPVYSNTSTCNSNLLDVLVP